MTKVRIDWDPILKDKAQQYAADFVKSVAAYLGNATDSKAPDGAGNRFLIDSGFTAAGGRAGYALFYSYLHLHNSSKSALQRCNNALMQCAEAVAKQKYAPSLYGGLAGVAWIIEHVCSVLGKKKVPGYQRMLGLNNQIDDFLLQWLKGDDRNRDYDLINGLVGIGVYFLERLPREKAYAGLEEIVQQLSKRAELKQDGICWFTPPNLIRFLQKNTYPKGCYNLGLAHGIPGVIALLGHIYSAKILRGETERLLRGSISWILRHQLPDTEPSAFDYALSQTTQPCPARLAWCYGDAGVAAALFSGANDLNDDELRDGALRIAYKAARRPVAGSGVVDAGFCHGAFGLAHIFNRFYQATREPLFLETALRWFDHGWQMRKPDRGISGYLFYETDSYGTLDWRPVPGLLTGITGLGLVTLAGISNQKPDWDRFFLLDVTPGSSA